MDGFRIGRSDKTGGGAIGRRIYYHGGESRLVPSHACMCTITSLDTTDFPVTKMHSSPPTSLDLFLRLLERGRDTFAIGIYIYIYIFPDKASMLELARRYNGDQDPIRISVYVSSAVLIRHIRCIRISLAKGFSTSMEY